MKPIIALGALAVLCVAAFFALLNHSPMPRIAHGANECRDLALGDCLEKKRVDRNRERYAKAMRAELSESEREQYGFE
ncbi:hypothetical protein [Sphingopyxis sp. GW247-27LB]|uniref:hypothetical protein n=1 Tax=Sphingopyxis sp. GW247-27LB TaxID=2012632 RepID=UPI001140C0AA|nr:hypothetical protein [Sphingopyxis sp. GW247-27LB]